MIVCIAEDRKTCEVSVKLVLLSLTRYCRGLPVELFYPPADSNFETWLQRCPQVNLHKEAVPGAYGWNVKPQALLALLNQGHEDVIWIDSDIVVAKDFRLPFTGLTRDTLVITEEALYGVHDDADAMRARKWGFVVGRALPFTANTGVIRVTASHIPLLIQWRSLLESDIYRSAQQLAWAQRPVHLYGDQDVLTALLSSREYADIPIKFLQRGRDIVQYFGPYGYTCAERLNNLLHGPPAFLHSQVSKPWAALNSQSAIRSTREYFDALYLDLSPYTLAARKFQLDLDKEECRWMKPRFRVSTLLRFAGFNYPPLTGLPIAAVADLVRLVKRALRPLRTSWLMRSLRLVVSEKD